MTINKSIFNKYYLSISLISMFLIILIFYTSSSFTKSANDDKLVVIYFADNISFAHQKIINNFNKKYEGKVKVVPIDLPFIKFSTNERKELLTRSLRSKSDRIDVFAVDLIWVKRFAKWSLKLENYFPKDQLDKYIPYSLESCYYDNSLYALPMYIDISTMFYRDDLLRKIPDYSLIKSKLQSSITWEEFINLGNRLREYKDRFYTFPADEYEGLICSFIELVLSQNPNYFSSTKINFNVPEIKKSLKLLIDLVNKYRLTTRNVVGFKEQESYKYFLNNDGLFVRGWPSFIKDFRNIEHDTLKDEFIKQVPLPHFQNSKPSFTFGGWNLMISKYTSHPAEALEFIKYISSEESQKVLYQDGAYLPIIKSVYNSNESDVELKKLTYFYGLFKSGVHRPYWKNYTRVSDILANVINKVIRNELTVDEAVVNLNKKLNSEKLD